MKESQQTNKLPADASPRDRRLWLAGAETWICHPARWAKLNQWQQLEIRIAFDYALNTQEHCERITEMLKDYTQ